MTMRRGLGLLRRAGRSGSARRLRRRRAERQPRGPGLDGASGARLDGEPGLGHRRGRLLQRPGSG